MCVLGNHPLMLLELIPRDIPGVMVPQQDAPVLHRFGVAFSLASPSVGDGSALGRPSKHIRPSINRMFQDLDNRVICKPAPFDPDAGGAVPRYGQLDIRLYGP